jgi:hypothetical protein
VKSLACKSTGSLLISKVYHHYLSGSKRVGKETVKAGRFQPGRRMDKQLDSK